MSEQFDVVLRSIAEADKTAAVVKLARTTAHELNNILTVVVGNLALLHEAMPPDPTLAETVADVRGAVDRAIALSERLQDFTARQTRRCQPAATGS